MLRISLGDDHIFRYLISNTGTYHEHSKIQFGLQPAKDVVGSIFGTLNGRTSVISLADADQIATVISTQFQTPVRVIKEMKISIHMQNELIVDGEMQPGVTEEDVYLPEALEITDLSRLREMIQFCETQGYIDLETRAALNPFITEVETILADAARLSPEATPAQTAVIRLVAEPYIDAIIEECRNAESNEALLGKTVSWGLTLARDFRRRDIAFAVLLQTMQRDPATLFYEQFEGLKEACADSGNALQNLYHGSATLESTYRRQGNDMPSIEAQRKALLEFVDEKLTQVFGEEKDPQVLAYSKEFLQALRKTMFVEGYPIETIKLQGGAYTINVDNFNMVLHGLRGNFGESNESEYEQTFAKMRRSTENQMFFAQMPFQL